MCVLYNIINTNTCTHIHICICTAIVVICSTIVTFLLASDKYSYQLAGIDAIINSYVLMLSFDGLDKQYNKLCKCCIKCVGKCFIPFELNSESKDNNSTSCDQVSCNDNNIKGEISNITIYGTHTNEITKTQNEGRKIIFINKVSSTNDDNELKTKGDYEVDAVKKISYYIDNSKTDTNKRTPKGPDIFITPNGSDIFITPN